MVQHFQDFLLCPGPPFFITTRQLFLIHHFGGEKGQLLRMLRVRRLRGLDLREVDGPDVAGTEAVEEAEVRQGERVRGAADGVPARVAGGGGGAWLWGGREGEDVVGRGGGGSPGGLGAGASRTVDVGSVSGGAGGGGGVEAHALKVVCQVVKPRLHGSHKLLNNEE